MSLDAGSVHVDIEGRLDRKAFDEYDRLVKKARSERPVKTELEGDFDRKGFEDFDRALARARAHRDVSVDLRARADTSGFGRFGQGIDTARRGLDALRSAMRQATAEMSRGGSGTFRVRSDTSGLSRVRSALASLRSQLGGLSGSVSVDGDLRGVGAVRSLLEGVRSAVASLRGSNVNIGVRTDTSRLRSLLSEISSLQRALRGGEFKTDLDISLARGKLRTLRAEARRVSDEIAKAGRGGDGDGGRGWFRGAADAMGDFNRWLLTVRNGMRLLRFPAMAAGLGLITKAATAATAGLTALGGAVGPGLVAAAAGGVGSLTSLAQGFGVARLATSQLGSAIGGLNEPLAKSSAAWKRLSPLAKRFAEMIHRDVKPGLRSLQQAAQRNLFPGLEDGIKGAMRNLPAFRRVISATASALGDMARRGGRALGSREWGRDLEKIGLNNVRVLRNLGAAAGHVGNALRHAFVSAGPMVRRMSADARGLAQRLSEAAKRGRESGSLGRFFDRAYGSLKRTLSVLTNFGKGLINIASIGRQAIGDRLFRDLDRLARKFREFTASTRGRTSIARWFREAEPGARELARLVGAVGREIGKLGRQRGFAALVRQIRTELVPAVSNVIAAFTKHMGPPMVRLFTNLARLLEKLAPTLGMISGAVADVVGWLAKLAARDDVFGSLVRGAIAFGVALKALQILDAVTGLTKLVTWAGRLAAALRLIRMPKLRLPRIPPIKVPKLPGLVLRFARAAGPVAVIAELVRLAPIAKREADKIRDAFKQGTGPGLKQAAKSMWSAFRETQPALDGLIRNFDKLRDLLDGRVRPSVDSARERLEQLGPAVRDALRRGDTEALRRYGDELRKLGPGAARAAQLVRAGLAKAADGASVNFLRVARGLRPVPKAAEQAVGQMLRSFRKIPKVQRWALKTNDPEVITKLARVTTKLRAMGKTKAVAKIIADSKSPEEAYRRVNAYWRRLHNRRARVRAEARDNASKILKRVWSALMKTDKGKATPLAKLIDRVTAPIRRVLNILGLTGKKNPRPKASLLDRVSRPVRSVLSLLGLADKKDAKPRATLLDRASRVIDKVLGRAGDLDKSHSKPKATLKDDASALFKRVMDLSDKTNAKHAKPKTSADTNQAQSALESVIGAIARIKSKTVTITVRRRGGHATGGYVDELPAFARGGDVDDAPRAPRRATRVVAGMLGDRGYDTETIRAGRGEAILTRHQQGWVESALRSTYDMTLGQLFDRVRTPHYADGAPAPPAARERPVRRFARGGFNPWWDGRIDTEAERRRWNNLSDDLRMERHGGPGMSLGPGYRWAEDRSIVRNSFHGGGSRGGGSLLTLTLSFGRGGSGGGMRRAEDGSLVPSSFYDKVDYRPKPAHLMARGGIVGAPGAPLAGLGGRLPRPAFRPSLSFGPLGKGEDAFSKWLEPYDRRIERMETVYDKTPDEPFDERGNWSLANVKRRLAEIRELVNFRTALSDRLRSLLRGSSLPGDARREAKERVQTLEEEIGGLAEEFRGLQPGQWRSLWGDDREARREATELVRDQRLRMRRASRGGRRVLSRLEELGLPPDLSVHYTRPRRGGEPPAPGEPPVSSAAERRRASVYAALERAATGSDGVSNGGVVVEPLTGPLTDHRSLAIVSGMATAGMGQQGGRRPSRTRIGAR